MGHYTLLNPLKPEIFRVKDFELKIEDNYLVTGVTFSEEVLTYILRNENADEAIIEGLGRGAGETVRVVKENKSEILTYSGLRFKRKK